MKKSLLVLLLSCVYLFSLTAEKFVETYSTNNVKVSVTIENCHYVITDMYAGGVKLDFAEIGYIKGDNKYKQENGKWKKVTELTCVNSNSLPEMKDISNPSGTLFSKIGSEYNTKKVNTINDTPYIPLSSDVLEDLSDGTFVLVGTKSRKQNTNSTYIVCLKPESLFMKAEYSLASGKGSTDKIQTSVFNTIYEIKEKSTLGKYDIEKTEEIINEFATLISASIYSNTELVDGKYPIYSPGNVCENTCKYLSCHLEKMYENNYPVLQSLISINSDFDYYSYKDLTSEEKNNIVDAAKRYVNWAVEYKTWFLDVFSNKTEIYDIVDKEWSYDGESIKNYYRSEFPPSSDYNAIPYAKGGTDTPRTFWYKLRLHKELTKSKDVVPSFLYDYDTKSYKPGGISGLYRNTGVDSLGFLTGVLSMTNETKSFIDIRNNNKPAYNLLNKTKQISAITNADITKTMEEGWKDCRFSVEDIDNFSCVIPYYSEIQKGDILVKYKDGNTSVAVVIDVGVKKNKNDITVIYVEEKEYSCCKKAKWNELEDSDSYTPRKLVVNNSKDKKAYIGKDFASVEPNNIEINIGSMYEEKQTYIPEKSKWRFIPNTGECLVLDNIEFKFFNKAGVNLAKINKDLYQVMIIGAKDCNYSAKKSSDNTGNVYNNKSTQVDFIELNRVGRNSNTTITANKKNDTYTLAQPIKYKIGSDGILESLDGYHARVGIRPSNFSQAYPGDDFLLSFAVNYGNKSKKQDVQGKDYIAFYDKKMLWRANLYIVKYEEELNKQDWNDVHPWNAPASSEEFQKMKDPDKADLIKWWSTDWGYNEWNRKLSAITYLSKNNGKIFDKLSELPQGDGKQVTDLLSFTPIRTVGGKMSAPTGNNVIYNTVAYSYPEHAKESGTGDSGSMDSPFDFNKKMLYQYRNLNKWYNQNGVKNQTITDNYSSVMWNNYYAPGNSWYHYEVEDVNNISFVPSLGLRIGFSSFSQDVNVNGETGDINAKKKAFMGTDFKGKDGVFEAGTDCIGFAQRAASYNDNKYTWIDINKGWTESDKNNFKDTLIGSGNRKYPYVNENGETHGIAYNVAHTWDNENYDINEYLDLQDVNKKTGLRNNEDILKQYLLRIIPGDIFVKDNEDDKKRDNSGLDDDYFNDHIAIIAEVPENMEKMTVDEILHSIKIIEGEFGWRIQSVIKELSLEDYQNKYYKAKRLEKMYSTFDNYEIESTSYTKDDDVTLKCKCWAIRRLLWK